MTVRWPSRTRPSKLAMMPKNVSTERPVIKLRVLDRLARSIDDASASWIAIWFIVSDRRGPVRTDAAIALSSAEVLRFER